jgi:hypothetical protein
MSTNMKNLFAIQNRDKMYAICSLSVKKYNWFIDKNLGLTQVSYTENLFEISIHLF